MKRSEMLVLLLKYSSSHAQTFSYRSPPGLLFGLERIRETKKQQITSPPPHPPTVRLTITNQLTKMQAWLTIFAILT